MPNDIDSFDEALRQTAAHELGHAMYALVGGMPYSQIDFQVRKIGESGPFELHARTYHAQFDEELDRAAHGLAGVIAQELFLNPRLEDSELYERAQRSPSLSETDRALFEALGPDQLQAAFNDAVRVVRLVLPHFGQQVGLLFNQFKAQLAAGATSAGFHFSRQNQQLIVKEVPILGNLF
jgi:hypothetical protein